MFVVFAASPTSPRTIPSTSASSVTTSPSDIPIARDIMFDEPGEGKHS